MKRAKITSFGGYDLDVDLTSYFKSEKMYYRCLDILDAVVMIPKEKMTLRMCESYTGINHNTLHHWIHEKIPFISSSLYSDICDQFIWNIKNQGRNHKEHGKSCKNDWV